MESNGSAQTDMGVVSRVFNIFTSPSATFQALIAKPDWVTPLVVMIGLFLVTGFVLKDIIQQEQAKATHEAIMKSERIPDSDKEQMAERQVEMMKKFWFVGVIIGAAAIALIYFAGALFLRVGAKMILGGTAPFLAVVSIFGYSQLIELLAALVKVPLMAVNHTMRVHTGLGLLMPNAEATAPLYVLLTKFDVFTFWQLAVLTIGVAMLYKVPKGKSAMFVGGLWLIWVLVQVGLASVGVRFG